MNRRKLVFFTSADPAADPGALFRAYHFANVAGRAGLEAEVRLAGDAVRATKLDLLPDSDMGRDVRSKIQAGADGPFEVSL
jgi:hypothetical protein